MSSLHADEAFLGHYQLSHDPFAARVPGFKFFPAQRKPVLGQLHHLARYSPLLLLVTGPEGSGKTLLRQALVASTNKQTVHSVVLTARGSGDAASVLHQLSQEINAASPDIEPILEQVVQMGLTGQEVYLLVDDAEQLDESALEALLTLAAGTPEGRVHVFLFGEGELVDALELIDPEHQRFHLIELAPYTVDETREYIAQRLEGAGAAISVLSDEQISEIHEQSEGWPGTINQVARDTMIEAMLASRGAAKRPTMGLKMPKKHVLALAGVVVVAVAAAVIIPGRNHDKSAGNAPEQAQLPLGQGQPTQETSNNGNTAIEFAGNSKPVPLPMVGQSQPVMRGPLAEQTGMGDGDDAGPAASTSAQQPPTVTTTAPPVGVPAGPAPTAPVASAAQPVASVAPVKPVTEVKPAQVASAKPAPVHKPVEKPVEKPAAKPVATGNWYAAQNGGSYVVQIFGTSSEEKAKSFVNENGSQYRYFRKNLQGKPLFVVTYGSFPNREAALTAIKNLPAKVQAGKPWPRTVASVQQEAAATR